MKSRFRMLLAAITFFAGLALLFAALALPLRLTAQDKQDPNRRHHHYRLVDLGTFGGPNSSVPTGSFGINGSGGARAISNQGTVAGLADTSTKDPSFNSWNSRFLVLMSGGGVWSHGYADSGLKRRRMILLSTQ